MTGHVIAVHAARPGLEDGRGVKVADAQLLEVAHDGLRVGEREVFVHLHPVGRDRDPGIGVQHPLDAFPHVVGGFLARVGFYRGRLRHGYARGRKWLATDILHWMRSPEVRISNWPTKFSRSLYEFAPSTENGVQRPYCNEEEPMPLSGEAIRMMNYIDDISTTLRRILALSPTLSAEERKRVGEYLKSSSPSADEAMAALNLK